MRSVVFCFGLAAAECRGLTPMAVVWVSEDCGVLWGRWVDSAGRGAAGGALGAAALTVEMGLGRGQYRNIFVCR